MKYFSSYITSLVFNKCRRMFYWNCIWVLHRCVTFMFVIQSGVFFCSYRDAITRYALCEATKIALEHLFPNSTLMLTQLNAWKRSFWHVSVDVYMHTCAAHSRHCVSNSCIDCTMLASCVIARNLTVKTPDTRNRNLINRFLIRTFVQTSRNCSSVTAPVESASSFLNTRWACCSHVLSSWTGDT